MSAPVQTAIALLLFEQEKIKVFLENFYLFGDQRFIGCKDDWRTGCEQDWQAIAVEHCRHTARAYLAHPPQRLILTNN